MICPRCQKAMFVEVAKEHGSRPVELWACLCGERMDDTIWFHRALMKPESQAARHDRIMRELHVAMVEAR